MASDKYICLRCGGHTDLSVCPSCGFKANSAIVSLSPIVLTSDIKSCFQSNTKPVTFFMVLEDVFKITGRGTVVVGKVLYGQIKQYEQVEVILKSGKRIRTTISLIEMPVPKKVEPSGRKLLEEAWAGISVGVVLRGIKKEDIIDAQALVNVNANVVHKKIRGRIYLLTKEEGGGHLPIFNYYKPWFRTVTKDYRGWVSFDEDDPTSQLTDIDGKPPMDVMLTPGCSASVHVEFDEPIAVFQGMQFDVHERNSEVIAKLSVEETEDSAPWGSPIDGMNKILDALNVPSDHKMRKNLLDN